MNWQHNRLLKVFGIFSVALFVFTISICVLSLMPLLVPALNNCSESPPNCSAYFTISLGLLLVSVGIALVVFMGVILFLMRIKKLDKADKFLFSASLLSLIFYGLNFLLLSWLQKILIGF